MQVQWVVEDSMLQASKVPVALEPLAFQGLPTMASQPPYQCLHSSLPRPHCKDLLTLTVTQNSDMVSAIFVIHGIPIIGLGRDMFIVISAKNGSN